MYYKIHDRRKFYSTLCQTAKRNQRYNLIQSTQNNSTSIEHDSKTLAQNKFNSQPKFYFFSKRCFSLYASLVLSLFRRRCPLSLFRLCHCDGREHIYIDKSHVSTNLLVHADLAQISWREGYA